MIALSLLIALASVLIILTSLPALNAQVSILPNRNTTSGENPFSSLLFPEPQKDKVSSSDPSLLVDEQALFKVSYPANWTKEPFTLGKFTGLESTPMTGFTSPN